MSVYNGGHVLSTGEQGEMGFVQIIIIPHMETSVLK